MNAWGWGFQNAASTVLIPILFKLHDKYPSNGGTLVITVLGDLVNILKNIMPGNFNIGVSGTS